LGAAFFTAGLAAALGAATAFFAAGFEDLPAGEDLVVFAIFN